MLTSLVGGMGREGLDEKRLGMVILQMIQLMSCEVDFRQMLPEHRNLGQLFCFMLVRVCRKGLRGTIEADRKCLGSIRAPNPILIGSIIPQYQLLKQLSGSE